MLLKQRTIFLCTILILGVSLSIASVKKKFLAKSTSNDGALKSLVKTHASDIENATEMWEDVCEILLFGGDSCDVLKKERKMKGLSEAEVANKIKSLVKSHATTENWTRRCNELYGSDICEVLVDWSNDEKKIKSFAKSQASSKDFDLCAEVFGAELCGETINTLPGVYQDSEKKALLKAEVAKKIKSLAKSHSNDAIDDVADFYIGLAELIAGLPVILLTAAI